jgi:isoquinoline 1-oxidoreductase
VEKNGYVATFAEISADKTSGEVRVVRVVTAFECGAIVNPDGLRNQVIGANIMGLGGALFESIEFENGKISNPHLAQYRVPRFRDIPLIEAVLLDRKDIPPAGAGETPIVGLAPAIGNAIFDATGIRLRQLPMVPRGLNNLKISA